VNYSGQPVKLQDCQQALNPAPGKTASDRAGGPLAGTELFLVEGDSAASAVGQLRNAQFQAVLPMQGKPMNAIKASPTRVAENPLFKALIDALGAGWGDSFELQKCRYSKVILLMDPDADGIHSGALLQMFFYRWMRPLLAQGRVELVRPPVGEVTDGETGEIKHAYTEAHFLALCAAAKSHAADGMRSIRYRGLAGIESGKLAQLCIHPQTRKTSVMGLQDAELAIEIFGSA
jgi:DNA gyrase subunit B